MRKFNLGLLSLAFALVSAATVSAASRQLIDRHAPSCFAHKKGASPFSAATAPGRAHSAVCCWAMRNSGGMSVIQSPPAFSAAPILSACPTKPSTSSRNMLVKVSTSVPGMIAPVVGTLPGIGSDIALFKGLMKAILDMGAEDRAFIAKHGADFGPFRADLEAHACPDQRQFARDGIASKIQQEARSIGAAFQIKCGNLGGTVESLLMENPMVVSDARGFADTVLHEVLDLCLMCKACKSECPLGVDMAKLKSETLSHHHDVHGIPPRSRVFGAIRRLNALGSRMAGVANLAGKVGPGRRAMEKTLGIASQRPLPTFHAMNLIRWFEKRGAAASAGASTAGGRAAATPSGSMNDDISASGVEVVDLLVDGGCVVHRRLGETRAGGRVAPDGHELRQLVRKALLEQTITLLDAIGVGRGSDPGRRACARPESTQARRRDQRRGARSDRQWAPGPCRRRCRRRS